jgi:hypothetical protein
MANTSGEPPSALPSSSSRPREAALESNFNEFGKDGWEIAENFHGGFVFIRPKP